jgi:hypothetical protein
VETVQTSIEINSLKLLSEGKLFSHSIFNLFVKILEKVGIIMQYSSSFSKVNTPESKREHLAIPAPHVLLFQTDFQNKMVDPTKEHQVVD